MPRRGLPQIFNFASALGGIIVLSPMMAAVAVLIKATSPGPVFFRQKRVGRGGVEFELMKFKTMRLDPGGPRITRSGDPRVTPVGRFLRKTKLDEFPQLINVLRGEMAIVGPRPEVREYVDLDSGRWAKILEVRPGITDPVTLRLRNEEELLAQAWQEDDFYRNHLAPYKVGGYLEYIGSRSALGDLRILAMTLLGVVFPGLNPAPGLEEIRKGWKDGKPVD